MEESNGSDYRRGLLTQLIDFRKEEVPLGAGGFVFNSKLFFVGGETVKANTSHIKLYPLGSFDDEYDFNVLYEDYLQQFGSVETLHDAFGGHTEGYLKLPRSALNKRVFVLDPFFDSNGHPIVPSISTLIEVGSEASTLTEVESEAPKTQPFVIPIKKEGKTLIYVLSHTPLFYKHTVPKPRFEVFDPHHNSWEKLEEPPVSLVNYDVRVVFEFGGKIFLICQYQEMFFDLETKKWQQSNVFGFSYDVEIPSCIINVCDDVYVGCLHEYVWAYQLGPNNKIRVQPLDLLCGSGTSTLCNLGGGLAVYVNTTYYEQQLHFVFVKFRISILKEKIEKHSLRAKGYWWPDPFVSLEIVDRIYKSVEYAQARLLDDNYFLHAYVH